MDVLQKIFLSKNSKIHHKTLKVVYQSEAPYDELLELSNEVSVHQKHIRLLLTEVYKSIMQLNPEFMWSYFNFNNIPYSLRKGSLLHLPQANTINNGTNSLHFRACILWNNLQAKIKSSTSVLEFKENLKLQGNIDCSCALCS